MRNYDVVIVNFNGEKIIADCLKSIVASSLKPEKIIIVDNASNDNSIKVIEDLSIPSVELIKSDQNIGFGPGNNLGMEKSKSEFILFMNNDLLLDSKCAQNLIDGFIADDIAIINPLIINGWDRKDESKVYSFGASLNDVGFGYSLTDTKENKDDLTCFSGACFMARGVIIKEVEFEPAFFLYYEEPEISAKILRKNLKISRIKEAKCYHLESYSSPKKAKDGIAFRQYYGIQNRWYMIGKHWPAKMIPKAVAINLVHLLFFSFFFLVNRKFSYLKLIYLAPYKFLMGTTKRYKSSHSLAQKLTRDSVSSYLGLGKKVLKKD